jgi:glycosyltransferase involved in cell wall biosynthesis
MKICFLSLGAYPLLARESLGITGGAELQQVLLARELVSHGYEVIFITYGYKQKKCIARARYACMGNITVVNTYEIEKIQKIDLFSKFRYLLKALNRVDADLYFYSAGSPGVLPLFKLITKKKYVYRIPSDMVVLGENRKLIIKIADRLDIQKADAVVVQTEFQRVKLMENFRVNGVLIRNAYYVPQVKQEKTDPPIVLWVGSIYKIKRPQLFLELAKAIPNGRFEMVGGPKDFQLFRKIRDLSRSIPNLTFHGLVPYHEIDKYFERASILVNTSSIEGFPNTFLQAWAHYMPVVSLSIDPDGIIQKNRLGFYSKTFKQLVSDVNNLLEDKKLREKIGVNGRNYVEEHHDIKKISRKYIQLFEEIERK